MDSRRLALPALLLLAPCCVPTGSYLNDVANDTELDLGAASPNSGGKVANVTPWRLSDLNSKSPKGLEVRTDIQVELNGTHMMNTNLGGCYNNRAGEPACSYPEYSASLPTSQAPSSDVLTMKDSRGQWRAVVHNLLVDYSVQMTAPADGQVRLGDTVELTFFPADAQIMILSLWFYSDNPSYKNDGDPVPEFDHQDQKPGVEGMPVRISGNRAQFGIGQAPLGGGRLSLDVGFALNIESCEGPAVCKANARLQNPNLRLTVVP